MFRIFFFFQMFTTNYYKQQLLLLGFCYYYWCVFCHSRSLSQFSRLRSCVTAAVTPSFSNSISRPSVLSHSNNLSTRWVDARSRTPPRFSHPIDPHRSYTDTNPYPIATVLVAAIHTRVQIPYNGCIT